MPRKKHSTWGWPRDGFGPMELSIRTFRPVYLVGTYMPMRKLINTNGKWLKVLCVSCKAFDGNGHCFFIKEAHEIMPCMVTLGKFEIRFQPKIFFDITDRLDKIRASDFWNRAILVSPKDLVQFSQMVLRASWKLEKSFGYAKKLQNLLLNAVKKCLGFIPSTFFCL